MLITEHAEIMIKNGPEKIWDLANNPVNWTASNPEEHHGLKFYSDDNRPHMGVTSTQEETVAGLFATLKGHFLHVKRPTLLAWRGGATYELLGRLIKPRIPEGGVVKLEPLERGTRGSHESYIDVPDTFFGKIITGYFKRFLSGEKAIHDHAFKLLVYFKAQLEKN